MLRKFSGFLKVAIEDAQKGTVLHDLFTIHLMLPNWGRKTKKMGTLGN